MTLKMGCKSVKAHNQNIKDKKRGLGRKRKHSRYIRNQPFFTIRVDTSQLDAAIDKVMSFFGCCIRRAKNTMDNAFFQMTSKPQMYLLRKSLNRADNSHLNQRLKWV